MGELLGITGAIGSGKTTLAGCLAKAEPDHATYETGQVIAEVADAFNQALKAELAYETSNNPIDLANQVLIWLPDALSEHLHHDVVWNQLAITKHQTLVRPELYQKLFAYLAQAKASPQLLEHRLTPQNKKDYRALLQWLGGYLVGKVSKTIWLGEILRRVELRDNDKRLVVIIGLRYPSDAEVVRAHGGRVIAITRPGAKKPERDVTEDQRAAIKADIVVHNNGSPEDLQILAETIWRDIGIGKPRPLYRAKASG